MASGSFPDPAACFSRDRRWFHQTKHLSCPVAKVAKPTTIKPTNRGLRRLIIAVTLLTIPVSFILCAGATIVGRSAEDAFPVRQLHIPAIHVVGTVLRHETFDGHDVAGLLRILAPSLAAQA